VCEHCLWRKSPAISNWTSIQRFVKTIFIK
jgi:hypothetical protein